MAKKLSPLIDLRADHEGQSSLDYVKTMVSGGRAKAFKRAYNWALVNDLYGMIKDGIPKGQRYGTLFKSLKLGELQRAKDPTFGIFIDSKAKNIKKMDAQRTIIYIKKRQAPMKQKPEIQMLVDRGPWTSDTIPFWPSKKDAVIIQRKTDARTMQKVVKMQKSQKDNIRRELLKLNVKSVDDAVKHKLTDGRKAKAFTDVASEMTTLEFGGGKTKASGLWRNSVRKLPTMQKTLLTRYKRIGQILYNPRNKAFAGYPKVDTKLKMAQLSNFQGFQKLIAK